ncbi:MAG: sensor histidine kinase [Lachnospiraceae bacterium]|nr:sensor histidine kinase [Lachnospiraceae bacterium]
MKLFGKLKYISNRVFLIGMCALGLLVLSGIVQILRAMQIGDAIWPGMLTVTSAAALFGAGWIWVIKPYRSYEKKVRHFLEGYIVSAADMEKTALTPSTLELIENLEKILRSPQMMELNRRQAQYLALQNQINPHFLYNTLESIRSEALLAGLDGVADMTEALAKFFRYTITKVDNLVSVEEELDNCETYFRIQKHRFGDRLQLHIEYDPEEWPDIMNCQIPKLTLQPILENSIIHGTELKIGEGNIRIRFKKTESRLLICISDDGVGMDESTLAALNEKLGKETERLMHRENEQKGGIALLNVNSRIHLIFGDEYGMHVYSVPQRGTDVEISIPITTKRSV